MANGGDGKQPKPVRAGCRATGDGSCCQAAWGPNLGCWVKPEADGAKGHIRAAAKQPQPAIQAAADKAAL